MTTSDSQINQLKHCLLLAQKIETHAEANQEFTQLLDSLKTENPQMAQLLETLWQEAIAARRSVAFWQQMSNVEKEMASNMMETMTQMRQDYLRLMQEM